MLIIDLTKKGFCIFDSIFFKNVGDQLSSLIWEGYGFELHIPENTCSPGKLCDIKIDVIIGGEFMFPIDVEPVSAVFIISIKGKFYQPLQLRIQHCVGLETEADCDQLHFYRASLKETSPPFVFKEITGRNFNVNNNYGEIDLPAFCGMAVGRDTGNTSNPQDGDDHSDERIDSSKFCIEKIPYSWFLCVDLIFAHAQSL